MRGEVDKAKSDNSGNTVILLPFQYISLIRYLFPLNFKWSMFIFLLLWQERRVIWNDWSSEEGWREVEEILVQPTRLSVSELNKWWGFSQFFPFCIARDSDGGLGEQGEGGRWSYNLQPLWSVRAGPECAERAEKLARGSRNPSFKQLPLFPVGAVKQEALSPGALG